MKIFSSFDTNYKEFILKKEKELNKGKVLIIGYSNFFYLFFVKIPFIFLIISLLFCLFLLIKFGNNIPSEYFSLYIGFFSIIIFIFFFFILLKIIKKYIDYKLDFLVVTSNKIIHYNQEGIFKRIGKTISLEKIKTITVTKDGLIRSLFNIGKLIILTEGDEKGEIYFPYIDNPDIIKQDIFKIIHLGKENEKKIQKKKF